ncbi:MAG: BrnA antitoxin family protein [Paracoccus sp. (in: a-proteobacteria)]|uniref:BrnA antitoxin family protein n=1 Tax=Paracoccus sp. TaxID=267 RepID=UPI0026E100D4|nr:BrnA antitoxin family protein [Paracoccus sp. (in: a-proteobacteria)]MDO5632479.1 BrnA antitoxin family protein [Paracoccus sp. (in: a-proteobacteria)]
MAITRAEAARRQNYHYMADAMRMLEWDLHNTLLSQMRIPAGWHEIARDKGTGKTRRVTIRLDEDIVKFFQSMGTNWQPRVNRVLSVWMHARLAGLIDGAETMDYLRRTEDDPMDYDGQRPWWADGPREMVEAGMREDMAWSGSGAGVPLGDESSEMGRFKAEGRVRMARGRVERG